MNWEWIQKFNKLILLAQEKMSKKQFILLSAILVGLSAGIAAITLKSFVYLILCFENTKNKYKYRCFQNSHKMLILLG